jgi:hypothetical protein
MNDSESPGTGATSPIEDFAPPAGNPSAGGAPQATGTTASPRRDGLRIAAIVVAVLGACAIAYLALAVPGAWFPRAAPKAWGVADLGLVRGATGRVAGDELVVVAPDANGISLVSVTTDVRAIDYPGIAWIAADLREDADVRLLWRTDVAPNKLNSVPLRVESGRTLPAVMSGNPAWVGHVTGLALAVHGPLAQPVRIRGVVAKPMGARETVRDRLGEWFAFESWNGASINTIVGGADNQVLPLPAVLALVVGLSGCAFTLIRRWRPRAFGVATPVALAGLFVAAWLALDARWTWNLLRQERATAAQYAGKDAHDKHLASEDGALFAFTEKALAVLPRTPVRIFIVSDADYFRGRAAYHLYPHSVYFNPRSNRLVAANDLHAGDWLLVFQRHGIQFDPARGKIRWDANQTVDAEVKLVEPGAALFVIR